MRAQRLFEDPPCAWFSSKDRFYPKPLQAILFNIITIIRNSKTCHV